MNDFKGWPFLAGIAVFIFGMGLMEEAIRALAKRPFKKFLQKQTGSRFRAVVSGTIVTAVLQSSSVVLFMVLSFVGAGIMSMRNALAVVLGSNLGTTLNSWVVATIGFKIDLEQLSYPILAVALIGLLFRSQHRIYQFARLLIGFALLFMGLEWMKSSFITVVQGIDLSQFFSMSPLLFIPIGFLITALIQSSSATMAITLTALHSQAIPFAGAAGIIIGSELGTAVKLLLGTGGMPDKKRVVVANLFFNGAVTLIASALLFPYLHFIQDVLNLRDPLIGLVLFQSAINLAGIVVCLPFLGWASSILSKRFEKVAHDQRVKYLQPEAKIFMDAAITAAEKEATRLLLHGIRFNRKAMGIEVSKNAETHWWGDLFQSSYDPKTSYDSLKILQGEILEFLADLPAKEMKENELNRTGELLTLARDVVHASKNMKDIVHNLQDWENSSNDVLHGLYQELKKREENFYRALETALQETNLPAIERLQEINPADLKKSIEATMKLLGENHISEYDASTIMNVHRELYSAHKALIAAVLTLNVKNSNSE